MTDWRINTPQEIEAARASGHALAQIMSALIASVRPGMATIELGVLAERLIRECGGEPVFLGYGREWGAPPFPAALCVSVNEEVVHGIPRAERRLKVGDLLKLDIGMRYQGMITDMARTVAVGHIDGTAEKLKQVTEAGLDAGIGVLRAGARLSEYSQAVEGAVKAAGFSCVRDLVGHGVGKKLHEEPQIPNYVGSRLPDVVWRAGMTIALEPMVNVGGYQVELAADGWTFVTRDRSLSAHVEDTVLITETGCEILTRLQGA